MIKHTLIIGQDTSKSPLVVIMGVSGTGKSTIGASLAKTLQWQFVEADDFHSMQAKQRMADGLPLDDKMREPWIRRLEQYLSATPDQPKVLAYSGLRKKHRTRFRQLQYHTRFFCLELSIEALRGRLNHRQSHFMPSSLIESQLAAMECYHNENDVISIDAGLGKVFMVEKILNEMDFLV